MWIYCRHRLYQEHYPRGKGLHKGSSAQAVRARQIWESGGGNWGQRGGRLVLLTLLCFCAVLLSRIGLAEESWRDFDAELGASYELDSIDPDAFENALNFHADAKTVPSASAKTSPKTAAPDFLKTSPKSVNEPVAAASVSATLPPDASAAVSTGKSSVPFPAAPAPVSLANALNTAVAKKAEKAAAAKVAEESGKNLYQQLLRRSEVIDAELTRLMQQVDNPEICEELPPAREVSLRKNASVTIGGEMRADFSSVQATWRDPSFDPDDPTQGKGKSDIGQFRITTAKILLDARAGERWRAFLDINLQGYNGRNELYRTVNPNAPGSARPPTKEYEKYVDRAFVAQAYVEMLKAGQSGFGAIVGRVKLPFGLWNRPNLFAQSYMDGADLSTSYLMSPKNWENGVRLPHASRFVDPVTAVMLNYEWRDIIRVEAALFQEDILVWDKTNKDGANTYHELTDYGSLPRSWQIGFSLQPLEGWELTGHFRNRHRNDRGVGYWANSPYRWDFRENLASGKNDPSWDAKVGQWTDRGGGEDFGSAQNEQSLIVGLAAEVPNTNLAVRVEYARGWNQGFNQHVRSDGVNLGLSYKATPKLTIHAEGEWLRVKDGSWMAKTKDGGWARDCHDNNLLRAMVGAEYEVAKGLTLEAGWQYEYWRIDSARGGANGAGERRVNRANMFYAGTRFVF